MYQPIHGRIESLLLDTFTPQELALALAGWDPALVPDIPPAEHLVPRQYVHSVVRLLIRRRLWAGEAGFLHHLKILRPRHAAELDALVPTAAHVDPAPPLPRVAPDEPPDDPADHLVEFVSTREIEVLAWIEAQCRHRPTPFWTDHAASFAPLRPPRHSVRRLHVGFAANRWTIDAWPRLLVHGHVVHDPILEFDPPSRAVDYVYCPQGRDRGPDFSVSVRSTRWTLSTAGDRGPVHLHFDFPIGS